MTLLFEILLTVSLAFCCAQVVAAWLHRRPDYAARRPAYQAAAASLSPVSILKPLSGLDDQLAENLESFCRLDYPSYELIFCLQDPLDKALPLARELRARHPNVEISIVVGDYRGALNPKVANLIPGYRAARHDLVLVSDANVRVGPGYLREAVSHLDDPRVALVSHLVRGTGAGTIGAALDNGYLNGFIFGSVSLLDRLGTSCVIGKSMLMRRADLDRIGGFEAVQDFLAEDFVLATLFKKNGRRVVISPAPIDRVCVGQDTRGFLRRCIRWNAMRRTISGPGYALEPLTNPTLLSLCLLGVAIAAGDVTDRVLVLSGSALAAKVALDAGMNTLLGAAPRIRELPLTPVRDILLIWAWAAGYFTRRIEWRGCTLSIARNTRLVSRGPFHPVEEAPAAHPEAVATTD